MSTISLRLSDDDYSLIAGYAIAKKLNLSDFIRETLIEKIEEDEFFDEEKILEARERSKYEKKYDHTEVWKELGI